MGALKNPVAVLKRVNGGIEKGSMVALKGGIEGALKRVNGGIEKGQWGH